MRCSVKSFAPARHKTTTAVDALGDFIPRTALGKQQGLTLPVGHLLPDLFGYGSPGQFRELGIRQRDRVSHRHDCSLQMVVTVY